MAASISVQREASSRYAHPFTIVIVANPTLESPLGVGHYETDPVISDRPKFDLACQYIEDCLFGGLPNQAERLLSDPSVSEGIRILTVFEENAPPHDSNALVSENVAGQLVEPRAPKMRNYIAAVNLSADIIYAVTASRRYARASAYFTSDDQTRGGIQFELDSTTLTHRFWNTLPGTVAIHVSAKSLTALHEFGHAVSSYQNGQIVDLYVEAEPALNAKKGRPIPLNFGTYKVQTLLCDPSRNGQGYGAWNSYHCELLDPTKPAVMDRYPVATPPEACQHDRITRIFILDRIRAKLTR